MFGFIKEKIKKVFSTFTEKAVSLFSRKTVDEALLKELEILLITSDVGVKTTNAIMTRLRGLAKEQKLKTGEELKVELDSMLTEMLEGLPPQKVAPTVTLLVGINGSGKTTFAAKYAAKLAKQGKKVLLVAGDTFRAAATEQLQTWGQRISVPVHIGKENQDPASVIFDACRRFLDEGFDHLIIDTAGRLQTKTNLMNELEKIGRIIDKKLPDTDIGVWLTVDAMLGQNSFEQAKVFNEATDLSGIILTKLDGTGKGGIVFAITQEFKLPITYVTYGEKIDDLKVFDAKEYVSELLGS